MFLKKMTMLTVGEDLEQLKFSHMTDGDVSDDILKNISFL